MSSSITIAYMLLSIRTCCPGPSNFAVPLNHIPVHLPRGGRDLRRLLGIPTGRVLPVRDSPPLAEEASTRAAAKMEHAAQANERPSELLCAGPLSRSTTAGPTRATGPAQSSKQGCVEAGGDHKPATPRENLRPLPEERDQRHPGYPDEDRQGLASQEESSNGDIAVSPSHGPASQHAARGDELSSASSCHRGGQGQTCTNRMAHEHRGLELPRLEPHRAQTSDRPQADTPPARRGHPIVDLPAPELKGRGNPKVRSDATDEHSGTARVPVRHLSFGGVPEGTNSQRNLRGHGEVDWLHVAESLNLIGVSMKKDSLPHMPLAKKLGDMVYRRPGPSTTRPHLTLTLNPTPVPTLTCHLQYQHLQLVLTARIDQARTVWTISAMKAFCPPRFRASDCKVATTAATSMPSCMDCAQFCNSAR